MRLKKLKAELKYEVFLIPAAVLFIIFYIMPVIMGMLYSFTNMSLFYKGVEFVGLNNYLNIVNDDDVIACIKNTLIFAISSTLLVNVFAILLAVALDSKIKLVNLMRMIIFAPAVISSLVVGYIWSIILASNDSGLMNWVLNLAGIPPVNWMGDTRYALLSIIVIYVWQWTGWCMVIYLANLQTIPSDLYEAADIDGGNSFQKFIHITFPLLVTSVTVNTVLFMVGGLKVYDLIIATTNGGPMNATESFTTILLKKGFSQGQYGYGSSIAMVLFTIIIIITIIQLKFLNKWEKEVI